MIYWSLVLNPVDWRAMLKAGATEHRIDLQSPRLQELARQVQEGDRFAVYVTYAGLWVAVLQADRVKADEQSLSLATSPLAAVDISVGLPTAAVREQLSFLRHTRMVSFSRSPLRSLPSRDGERLGRLLDELPQGIDEGLLARRIAESWEERLSLRDRLSDREVARSGPTGGSAEFRRRAESVIRVPHLSVTQNELLPGQSAGVQFRLDVGLPDQTDQFAPAVLDVPLRKARFDVGVWLAATVPLSIEGEALRTVEVDARQPRSSLADYVVTVNEALPENVESASLLALVTQKGRPRGFVSRAFDIVRGGGGRGGGRGGWILRAARGDDGFDAFRSITTELEPDLTVFVRSTEPELRDFSCVVQTPHLGANERRGIEGEWRLPQSSSSLVEQYMGDFIDDKSTDFLRRSALVGAGIQLFRAAPDVFREVFWRLIDEAAPIATVFIISEEPYLPWELMIPNRISEGVSQRRDPLGVEFALGRWTGRRWGGPPAEIRINRSLAVAPEVPSVAHGADEAAYVAGLFRGTALDPASIENLDNTMRDSEAQLVHFACHGSADGRFANQELRLEGDESLAAYLLEALSGVRDGLARDRPFVFLNACECGRSGVALADARGFPQVLLNLQAVGVIAPLWGILDTTAFEIARDIYDTALGDPTARLGEIMARVRRRAYEDDPFDDTFAAYAYYGDPLARISVG